MAVPNFLSFVTNAAYAPGAVCLAQSLLLVGSTARLRVIATSEEARDALLAELASSPPPTPPVDVVLELTALPPAKLGATGEAKTHNGRGATLAVDAPRRVLFVDDRPGFILLDSDLIAVSNPDHLFELLREPQAGIEKKEKGLYATANFRLKKRMFGDVTGGSNFNAGVMAVPRPSSADGASLQALVDGSVDVSDGTNPVTEELFLNNVFRGRCGSLPRGCNTPKRVFHHAPKVIISYVTFVRFLANVTFLSAAAAPRARGSCGRRCCGSGRLCFCTSWGRSRGCRA